MPLLACRLSGAIAACFLFAAPSAVAATPIENTGPAPAPPPPVPPPPVENTGPAPSPPPYIGTPATPHPVKGVRPAWQDPFMAPNPRNSVHNDAWQTDVYTQFGGPLGKSPDTFSTAIGR